jgi:hypothetical protein
LAKEEDVATPLIEVNGIGPATAKTLAEHGIKSAEDLAAAKLGTIMAVPSFSEIRATRTIAAAKAAIKRAPAAQVKTPAVKKAAAKPVAKKKPAAKKKKADKKAKAKPAKKAKKAKPEKPEKKKPAAKKAKSGKKGKSSSKKKK